MFRGNVFGIKYLTRLSKVEKVIYTKVAWVVGGVLLFLVMLDASALGLALFFGLGWYAKQKYDLKKKVVRKRKKKVS
jgi:cell division protein FtsL